MRARNLVIAFTLVGVACILVAASAAQKPIPTPAKPPADSELSRIVRGYEIAPVPLNLRGRNRPLVGLGSYIVNAQSGCNDCHTNPSYAPGGDPHLGEPEQINVAGYLAGGRDFGIAVSDNITPDEHGLPAGLTFPEFKSLIRTGHDPDEPDDILQVMPWPVFRKMSDRDLGAIYEYLSAIPHIESTEEGARAR